MRSMRNLGLIITARAPSLVLTLDAQILTIFEFAFRIRPAASRWIPSDGVLWSYERSRSIALLLISPFHGNTKVTFERLVDNIASPIYYAALFIRAIMLAMMNGLAVLAQLYVRCSRRKMLPEYLAAFSVFAATFAVGAILYSVLFKRCPLRG